MSDLADDIRINMMNILKVEEAKTDLDNLAVISRVGMKVASSNSAELDADATSASSTALIDLGLRLAEATDHGGLKEIVLHNDSGYCILVAINDEYIVFGGLKTVYRIGYYLGYLRELVKKLNILISGGEISEMTLSLQEEELEKIKKQEEEKDVTRLTVPSLEEDKQAMDELLGFLDDWDKEEKEAMGVEDFEDLESNNIVSIPKSMAVGIPKDDETVTIPEEVIREVQKESKGQIKLYQDEVPPVPLEDYTPMEIEDQPSRETPTQVSESISPEIDQPTEFPTPDQIPSLDNLNPPDFEASAAEYDTEFVLEEESEALDSVLKDLGWEEEE